MSYWDSSKNVVVRQPPKHLVGSPGWFWLDCGCCGGLNWGGDFPVECETCRGNGSIALHLSSRILALYPGGPFCGVLTTKEIAAIKKLAKAL